MPGMENPADREAAVFKTARELEGGQRTAYLRSACGDDEALRRRVEELLDAEAQAGSFLEAPAAELNPPIIVEPIALAEHVEDHIGNYKLLQQIGEGGCGVVYMAEQERPVRRRVALKIIKLGMDTKQVIARFEAERQALALMDHANIAKVLDAGATETGRPYFVMELVRGIKITDYCDQNRLGTAERLHLFIQVCQAIQHAHQKGIIHRDIKPSNILVTVNDGVAVPKVIDFGIAKATQGRLTDQTLFTAFEQFIGTPAYMSPEQAVMTSLDIDTRSDIYSLGVLLYELLTGRTPFDSRELLEAGLDEIRRTIQERDPLKPSTLLRAMGPDELTATANRRQIEPPKLIHLLRGDMDWIVMKCLAKDSNRRYETANGLARDIERHLRHEPVTAFPPSRLYEFRKTVRRHRLGFAAATSVILALSVGTVVSTLGLRRALRAERAQHQSRQEAQSAASAAKRTLALSDLSEAVRLSEAHDGGAALAYLVRILSADPTNTAALTRAATLLMYRSWMLPTIIVTQSNWVGAEFSPDGTRFVTASWDNTARVWDSRTGAPVTPLLAPRAGSRPAGWAARLTARFSPDGTRMVTASGDGTARVWDASTGAPLTPWMDHGSEVQSPTFSPDGKRIATATIDGAVRVWSAESGVLELGPLPERAIAGSIEFSPDGQWIATSSKPGVVYVWDALTGTLRFPAIQHGAPVAVTHFSPDGKRIATATTDGTLRVWNAATSEPLPDVIRDRNQVLPALFSPDGKGIHTASGGPNELLWSPNAGAPRMDPLYGASGTAAALGRDAYPGPPLMNPFQDRGSDRVAALSPDGVRIVTASTDHSARVCDARTGLPLAEPLYHGGAVASAQFSPDGRRILTGANDSTARIWESMGRPALVEPMRHGARVVDLRLSRDGGRIVTASWDHTARVWDVWTCAPITPPLAHRAEVVGAEFSPDGKRVLTASADHTAQVWDASNGRRLGKALEHGGPVNAAHFSPHGDQIVTASNDGKARVWASESGQVLGELPHGDIVVDAQFSPDGAWVATASRDGTARVWDGRTGAPRTANLAHGEALVCVRFSPDGKQIVTGAEWGGARIWDTRSGRLIATLNHQNRVVSAEFSPDGQLVLTSSWDGSARTWSALTGLLRSETLRHLGSAGPSHFDGDGRRMVVPAENFARVRDTETALPLSDQLHSLMSVWAAQFSPDGQRVVTGSDDGTLTVRDVTPLPAKCPDWLLPLMEAVSGQVLNAQGLLEETKLNRVAIINETRRRLQAAAEVDPWTVFGRWFLADPATRTISPFSRITTPEYVARRIEDGNRDALEDAELVAGLPASETFCRQELADCRTNWPNEPARWRSSLSRLIAVLQHEGKLSEAAGVYQDVLRPSGPSNLVVNGSFEFGSFNDTPGINAMALLPGSGQIMGWVVTGEPGLDLEWFGAPYSEGLSAAEGDRFLDLTGFHDHAPYCGVSQTIPTTVGGTYNVSFAVGSDERWDHSIKPCVRVQVTGAPLRSFTVSDVGSNRWESFEFTFTAAATNTTLTFSGATTNSIQYIGLDNVSLTPADTREP